MNIMVVGGGGREHAIIKKLKENIEVKRIFALPGNGGIANDATCVGIAANDIDSIVKFAVENSIDFAVVAPDDPLVLGAVDALNAQNIKCFGPRKNAALIEGSKSFSKSLMKKYNIPTAGFEVFDNLNLALEYIDSFEKEATPLVVKADGLALGKGVILCQTLTEAKSAVTLMMADKVFGASGNTVVIEEFLVGPEVSVLTFTDGKTVVPMVSSMDHKRAHDNDCGLNTGGMGAIAPNPYYTEKLATECMQTVYLPTIKAMNEEGRTFKGCLYFGLILTDNGVKVIEYNCRFGDPETQVVLPLLESDLLTIMLACEDGTLDKCEVKFAKKSACCVVLASAGYPEKYESGYEISTDNNLVGEVYIAGAKLQDGKLLTAGGRVLGVTAVGDSLSESIDNAYEAVDKVHFANAFCRSDIGARALKA